MEPVSHYKICPQCGQHAPLNATGCTGCGRQYRTQFRPEDLPGAEQTGAYRQAPPPPPQLRPAPGSLTAGDRTPSASFPASPPAAAFPAAPAATEAVLQECADQYRTINMWLMVGLAVLFTLPVSGAILGLFGFFAWLLLGAVVGSLFVILGIAMLIYGVTAKPGIRRQVASVGVNARQWAAPLDRPLYLLIRGGVIAWVVCGVGLGVLGSVTYRREQARLLAEQQAERQAERQRQEMARQGYGGYYSYPSQQRPLHSQPAPPPRTPRGPSWSNEDAQRWEEQRRVQEMEALRAGVSTTHRQANPNYAPSGATRSRPGGGGGMSGRGGMGGFGGTGGVTGGGFGR